MSRFHPFDHEPRETREAIMQATYRALCRYGYADLTIERIGESFPKSTSLLYHHYDSKDELLVDFLEFVLAHYRETVPRGESDDAWTRLLALLDYVVDGSDPNRGEFLRALVELRAQAAHDDTFRDHFTRSDRSFQSDIADVVRSGIDQGTFRDVDPERVAALLQTTITGATVRRATTDDDRNAEAVREELLQYLETRLLVEDPR